MTNILGPPVGYVDILDIAQSAKAETDAKVARMPFRPSAAGNCAKEKAYQYAEYKGYGSYEKEPLSPSTQRIFNLGHSVEYVLLKDFKNVPDLDVKYQQASMVFYTLHDGTVVEGSLDAVFVYESKDGKKHKAVIDVKSKGDKYSNYYSSKWSEMDEQLRGMRSVVALTDQAFYADDLRAFLKELNDPFFAANFLQLNMYATNSYCIDRGIDHAAIIQYNKNDSRIREIRFRPDPAMAQEIIEKDKAAALKVDTDKSPEGVEREFTLGSIKCAFCNYKTTCWDLGKDGDPMKAFFKTLPDKKWPKDTNRLGDLGTELEEMFQRREIHLKSANHIDALDQEIIDKIKETGHTKIRLADGLIYELKFKKTPRPQLYLVRGKL